MKNWTLYILTAFIIQPVVANLPVSAESFRREAQHDQQHANREWREASQSRAKARSSARIGHHISAWLHSRHAAHEADRARKHAYEARQERSLAKHYEH